MKVILLNQNGLFFDGSKCSSITVTKDLDGVYEVVMFNNEEYVENKTRTDKWGEKINYKVGTRATRYFKKLEFDGIKPTPLEENPEFKSLAKFHLNQGMKAFSAENKNGDYVNYYEAIKK